MENKYNVKIMLPNCNDIYKYYEKYKNKPIVIDIERPSYKTGKIKLIKYILSLPKNILKIIKIINENNIHIVHTNDIIDFPAIIAAKFTKAKTVSHLRYILLNDSIQKRIFTWIFLKCSDQIICVSNAVKDNWFPSISKATIIYDSGPDLNKFSPSTKENPSNTNVLRIVTVGKLVNISGHENIIIAISKLDQTIKENIELSIIGGRVEGHEEYEKYLHELVINNNLSCIVSFIGYTANVHKYLNNADLFCFTPTWEHSFPNVILEAMAMSLPVLAFNRGGIKEQIEDGINGYLIENEGELRDKIKILFYDREKLKKMANNSLSILTDKFSLDKQISDINNIYSKLLIK